ncbi:cysteine peptidase family C39 domain-containing protein [Paenibacillus apiarius]|uniref:cysteine peptidase family C39 domain-containing protein n=1 Tax=Paenibacillus apiarius TaxID=46240 RepID=UPI003B3B4EFC
MFKRVPFIEQIEDSECGLACTAMLLGYYGHSITLHEIREQFGIIEASILLTLHMEEEDSP